MPRIPRRRSLTEIIIILLVVVIGGLFLLSKHGPYKTSAKESDVNKSITAANITSDPDKYKGEVVEVGGQVLSINTRSGTPTAVVLTDPGTFTGPIVIGGNGVDKLRVNNYVRVIGEVTGDNPDTGSYKKGASAPTIAVIRATRTTRNDAVAPTLQTKTINKTVSHENITVTLKSIEFAANESRFNISINNNSNAEIKFYPFNTKFKQSGKNIADKAIDDNDTKYQALTVINAGDTVIKRLYNEKADPDKSFTVHIEITKANLDRVGFDFND